MHYFIAVAIVSLFALISFGLTLSFLLLLIGGLMTVSPFVPLSQGAVDEAIRLLGLKKDSRFYDLGCGDGRAVFAAAKTEPGATCIGVEKAPFPYLLARTKKFLSRMPNAQIIRKDFADIPLGNATHVFLYLFPQTMEAILPKLQKELRSGARVVSCDFPFPGIESAEKIATTGKGRKHMLYLYLF